jgi:hypothetical protein
MTDQWFLDLDGVRSGPYQTSEVMGLIADGEVFPHHRIARSLKDTQWQTILDWRLEQARQIQAKRNSPQSSKIQEPAQKPEAKSLEASVVSPNEFDSDSKTLAIEPLKPKPPAPEQDDSLPPPIPTFAPGQDDFLKEIESMEKAMAEMPSDGPKRDPMAEMFDILQNTKQKREAKQLQSAQLASEEEKQERKKQFNVNRLVVICILACFFGLTIGQVVQFLWPSSPNTPSTTAKDSKTEPKAESKPESRTEVVDRSNDKMTIRAVVEKKPEPTPTKPVVVRTKPSAAPVALPPAEVPESEESADETRGEKKAVDKDLEELRDLKKELQELKALKEELKNTPLNDEFNEGDLGPYPDNAGGSFGGTNGSSAYPSVSPEGAETPGNSGRPKASPNQEEYRY